jgi:NitT/TauT family transport system ATP-binding protein
MLEIKNLIKKYENRDTEVQAVSGFNLDVQDHDFISIIGPSGCGKSTILRMISGLVDKTSGSITIDGKETKGPNKDKGVVFQNFSLFPWLTVEENILFGVNLKEGVSDTEKMNLLTHYLEMTGLIEFRKSYPKDLSGGMQQRVAIARALANTPKVILMDEPFGSLDSQTRSQMQELLTTIWEKEKMTVLFVTHDVSEAVFLSNKIVVLSKRPAQVKKIIDIPFARPRSHSLKTNNDFFNFVNQVQKELE